MTEQIREILNPLNDKLIVLVDEAESKSAGGIIYADQSKEKPAIGKVIAVGPGEKTEFGRLPMDVAENDKISFQRYAGTEVMLSGISYLVIRERDVLAVIQSQRVPQAEEDQEPCPV